MTFLELFSLHDIYIFIFTIALALGTGSIFAGNILSLTAIRDKSISHDEYIILFNTRLISWGALFLYSISGVGLFTLAYEAMLGLDIFVASMLVVTLIVVNTAFFQFYLLPKLRHKNNTSVKIDSPFILTIILSEIVSISSWLFLVFHHAFPRAPFNMYGIMASYFVMVVVIGGIYYLVSQKKLEKNESRKMLTIGSILMVLSLLGFFASFVSKNDSLIKNETSVKIEKTTEVKVSLENTTFTLDEVVGHAHIEDCWTVIDDKVFDVTPAAEQFPDIYTCGGNSTDKYYEIKPDGISERVRSYQIGTLGFSINDVAQHNTQNDCWLVIDNIVFDATPEAKLHPAAFNCGTDATDNYHKNHGKGISDKMAVLKIGIVDDGVKTIPDEVKDIEKKPINPRTELFVESGSWHNEDLMVIVEKDVENLLFIDGSTHTELGRMFDVGFQPHTSVFSPDGKYMYIIARNGWLTKIDLDTFEAVAVIDVGINSRGTALTDDGKYLAIGNYEPGNIVMVDPASMKILKVIPTIGEIDGEEIESRVGAVVQKGDHIIVALKDLNSVWIIDASQKDFPVVEKYWNIGSNKTPLHDAYLTPDGKFYIVASMGSDTVWVLNTETWEKVGEVKTGKTPHTGPGATWGTTTYVPSMGEGLITAIDTLTWEPIAHIKTGGPGLFIRSYPNDPTYPYVWADTSFGDHHDEIYVIDAASNTIVKTLKPVEGESSWHPEFTRDGKFVYVVSQTANEITIYDAYTFEVIKRISSDTPSAVSNVGLRIEEIGL
jgi:protein NirF